MYATADDAKSMIRSAIESGSASAEEYDVDAIFDTTFEYVPEMRAWVQIANVDEFWAAVEAAAR